MTAPYSLWMLFGDASTILSRTLSQASVMRKLSLIIRFFAVFSMAAGILIILSSVLATRFARIQEAVYYKILGAKSTFVAIVFTLENLFLIILPANLPISSSEYFSGVSETYIPGLRYTFHFSCILLYF